MQTSAQSTQVADARVKEENQLNNGLAYIADATGGEFVHNNNLIHSAVIPQILEKLSVDQEIFIAYPKRR